MRGRLRHRIEWGETDAAQIVFFPNYFRWFDHATHELLRSVGFPVESLLRARQAVPIIETQGRFLSALGYGDDLDIETWIGEVRTRAFRVEHVVRRGGDDVCTGYEVRMWVTLRGPGEPLQPGPLPEALRQALLSAR